MWSTALLLLEEAATELQSESHPADHHPPVSLAQNTAELTTKYLLNPACEQEADMLPVAHYAWKSIFQALALTCALTKRRVLTGSHIRSNACW